MKIDKQKNDNMCHVYFRRLTFFILAATFSFIYGLTRVCLWRGGRRQLGSTGSRTTLRSCRTSCSPSPTCWASRAPPTWWSDDATYIWWWQAYTPPTWCRRSRCSARCRSRSVEWSATSRASSSSSHSYVPTSSPLVLDTAAVVRVKPQICIKYSRFITCQSNTSKGRGHGRLPNWNPKNVGMLINQPISRCLASHSELCMSRLLNNQPRRISVYRLQRRPSFGFESSVSSTPMTSGDPVGKTDSVTTVSDQPHRTPSEVKV